MASIHTHRRALRASVAAPVAEVPSGPAQPAAFLRLRSIDLAPGPVSTWLNSGTGGATFNAVAETSTPPAYVASGGPTGGAYVRFTGNDFLRTAATTGITNAQPRTLFMVIRQETGGQRNAAGLGYPAFAQQLDVIVGGGFGPVYLHLYGASFAPSSGTIPAGWYLLSVRVVQSDYSSGALYGYLNAEQLIAAGGTIATINTPLRIGGGYYTDLNGSAPLDVAHVELHNADLSDEQFTTRASQLLFSYALT